VRIADEQERLVCLSRCTIAVVPLDRERARSALAR
jgi:hypothetical protein